MTIKTAGGNERTLRFSGTVKDVGQAQARMENAVYGYINLDTLAQLGEEPYLDQLKIVVAGVRRTHGAACGGRATVDREPRASSATGRYSRAGQTSAFQRHGAFIVGDVELRPARCC